MGKIRILFAYFICLLSICNVAISEPLDIYNLKLKNIDGDTVNFAEYKDQVLLIVNTASKCGFTPQYKDLEALSEKYKDRPFKVLGFPSNDFGNSEPSNNAEIKKFCKLRYDVKFPLFEKSSVSGEKDPTNPLFKTLTQTSNDELKGKISWNFEKFIVDRKGELKARFGPSTNPASSKITDEIDKLLNE